MVAIRSRSSNQRVFNGARSGSSGLYFMLLAFVGTQCLTLWLCRNTAHLVCDIPTSGLDIGYYKEANVTEIFPGVHDFPVDPSWKEKVIVFSDETNKPKKTKKKTSKTKLKSLTDNFEGVEARSFKPWPKDLELPCYRMDDNWWIPTVQRTPAHRGFLFVKEMKTGSSTLAGVAIRIARQVYKKLNKKFDEKSRPLCKSRFDHTSAWRLEYGKRIKGKSFLWTVIRDPTKRITSEFFHFHVSRAKSEPSDENFLDYIMSRPFLPNYYLKDLTTVPLDLPRVIPPKQEVELANKIIQEYDFIGITERMHESLVVLQMLLGLTTNDILYVKAKGSGSWDDGAANNNTCVYIIPSFVTPGMKEFFEGPAWNIRMRGDFLLYRAANRSLDLTIDRLGRAEFEENLAKFERAMVIAGKACSNIRFPCTVDGKKNYPTDCLWLDSGCGVACLDELPPVVEY